VKSCKALKSFTYCKVGLHLLKANARQSKVHSLINTTYAKKKKNKKQKTNKTKTKLHTHTQHFVYTNNTTTQTNIAHSSHKRMIHLFTHTHQKLETWSGSSAAAAA
jgi:D-hexose-6-phosphate mutarotase